jgi:hypothetical protein
MRLKLNRVFNLIPPWWGVRGATPPLKFEIIFQQRCESKCIDIEYWILDKMSHVLKIRLGEDIHSIIKLYTGEACWRNGKYIHIHRIPKDDPRYEMLRKKPRIRQIKSCYTLNSLMGRSWFKLKNGKFMVISVLYSREWGPGNYIEGYFWEMHYNMEKTICLL